MARLRKNGWAERNMTTPGHTASFHQDTPQAHGAARKHMRIEPDGPLRFERMISDLSARFVNVPSDQVDAEIELALKKVLEFFQVDRCGLIGISPDGKKVYVTHAVYAEGMKQVAGDIDLSVLFPWSYEMLIKQGKHVSVSRIAETPQEAVTDRQTWTAMGVRASLTVPLFIAGRVSSIIAVNAMRKERQWPEEYIPRLRLLGEIFINALERKKADLALRESEDRLSLATDAAGVMPWTIDMSSGRLWTTNQGREFFGFSPDSDMTLEGFLDIVHPDDRENLRRTVEVTMQSGIDNKAEYRIVCPDGSIRWVLSRGRPYAASSAGSSGLMGVSADITERKRVDAALRENEARLRDITFSMGDWVWEVDENGVYTYSSSKGYELLGHVSGKDTV